MPPGLGRSRPWGPAGDAIDQAVEGQGLVLPEVDPGTIREEDGEVGGLRDGLQDDRDHGDTTLDELVEERVDLLLVPGTQPRAPDEHRHRPDHGHLLPPLALAWDARPQLPFV